MAGFDALHPAIQHHIVNELGWRDLRPLQDAAIEPLLAGQDALLRGAALLLLWSEGYVESIAPPPRPAHILAQQVVALALQEGQIGRNTWRDWHQGLELVPQADADAIVDGLLEKGVLDQDTGMLFVGPEAERRYGRRHFMELMSVFTSDPQVTVLQGRKEIGTIDPMVLVTKVHGPRRLALAGRTWTVTSVDWPRRRAYVEPAEGVGVARWAGTSAPLGGRLVDAMRRVLLGADPNGVTMTRRASGNLEGLREKLADRVDQERTVVPRDADGCRWWTWAGGRANAVLHAALEAVDPALLHATGTYTNDHVVLRSDATARELTAALVLATGWFGPGFEGVSPVVSQRAIEDLKFGDLLPETMAARTLGERLADHAGAAEIAGRPRVERWSADR